MDYTQYDYDALVDHVTTKLQETKGWGNAYSSSTGQQLIQLIANETDQLHYMLERRSQEMYLDTARLDSSVVARASEVGYRTRRRVAARGDVELVLRDVDGNEINAQGNVTIPKNTSVFYGDVEFITEEDLVINTGASRGTVSIAQGSIETFTFDPTDPDSNLARFGYVLIQNPFIYDNRFISVTDGTNDYVDVISGGPGLPAIGAVSFAGVGDPYYDIRYPADGMRILFGDEISGVQPESTVSVDLLETLGAQVDIQATVGFTLDTETVGDDVNVTPANQYYYTLNNTTAITNGQESESVESIRRNAVGFIRTNNRAVTREDYRYWVLQSAIGGIVDAEAFGEQEINTLIYNANNVYVSYLTNDGNPLTTTEKQDLLDYMKELSSVTTHLIFRPANIVYIRYQIELKRDPSLPISNSELHDVTRRTMSDIFKLQEGSIGKEFQQSDIIQAFYNTKITRSAVTYNMIDFIKVVLSGLYKVDVPFQTNTATVTMDTGVTFTPGDQFVVQIDSDTFTVVAESGDTASTLISKMRDKIYYSTEFTVRLDGEEMRITCVDRSRVFTIDVSQGDFAADVTLDYIIRIPPPTYDNPNNFDLFEAGSFSIIDDQGTEYFADDGNGNLVDQIGSAQPGTVNYVTGEVSLPVLSNGTYYVQFKQDRFDNFMANDETAITALPAKESFNDANETLSTITLL